MNTPDADSVILEMDQANGVLRLKAAASFGDPVELSPEAARELGRRLIELADELD